MDTNEHGWGPAHHCVVAKPRLQNGRSIAIGGPNTRAYGERHGNQLGRAFRSIPRNVMKRSQHIRLLLLGAVTGASLAGCGRSPGRDPELVNAQNTYTNNQFVTGAGYYHAPYRAWFPHPHNYHVPEAGYFHGGRWSPTPDNDLTQFSRPTPEAVTAARTQQEVATAASGVRRGGFGGFLSRGAGG